MYPEIQKDTCTPMFIAALFTIGKCGTIFLSTDEWIRKLLYIYTSEYYSSIKSEIVLFLITRMDLEGIMLSEINQTKKDKYCIISLTCGSENQTNQETKQNENRLIDTITNRCLADWRYLVEWMK